MKLFKNPVFAVFLAIVVVIGSTLLNTGIKFGGKCRDLSDQFYDGARSHGTQELSIGSALETLCTAADHLAALARSYELDSTALSDASAQLKSQLASARGVSELYSSYSALSPELNAMIVQLSHCELTEADADIVNSCSTAVQDAQDLISSSSYNENVRVFLRRYDRFPTSVLAKLAGVELPEAFA